MDKSVSIIILTYNNNNYVIDCLDSLKSQTYTNFEVILVDNGSKNHIYQDLKNKVKNYENDININLIRIRKNLLYAGGMNKGIKNSKGEYICILTNDTVLFPDFIEKMVKFFEDTPEAGMASPKIKIDEHKDYIWFAGANINLRGIGMHFVNLRGYWEFDPQNFKYNNIETTGFAPGTANFIRREVINKIGLLDEIFLMYHEDPDWNLRAQKIGYKSYYVPTTIVYHKIPRIKDNNSKVFERFFFERNSQIFLWKHKKIKKLIRFYLLYLFHNFTDIILAIKRKRVYYIYLRIHSIWQGFRIGLRRRTNRSCKKYLVRDYHFIKKNEMKIFNKQNKI
jgi:GT2 family glycosyltransferase